MYDPEVQRSYAGLADVSTSGSMHGRGKERAINARFEAMCSRYLRAGVRNRAAGWEKGIVEKNVQDRR